MQHLINIISASRRRLDPDAAAYIAAVETALASSVTSTQRTAINDFVKAGKTSGWFPNLKRLFFPIWGNAAANAICMKSLTSGTFYGSVDHAAGKVRSIGETGYMDLNTTFQALGITPGSYHVAALYPQAAQLDGDAITFGVFSDPLATGLFFFTDGGQFFTYTFEGAAFYYGPFPLGIMSMTGGENSRALRSRNSSGVVAEDVYAENFYGSLPEINPYFLAVNYDIDGVNSNPFSFCDDYVGAFSIGAGITDAQDIAYTLALKNLWETCTGQTLP